MNLGRPRQDLSVLIPAAGSGERMGLGPKAFLELAGEPLVAWLSRKARRVGLEVIVAAPLEDMARMEALCPGCRCIPGGATRQATIARLMGAATLPWVLIQDVSRPFVSEALMVAVAEAARSKGAAAAILDPEVPMASLEGNRIVGQFSRREAGVFQAPQVFARNLLQEVLVEAERNQWEAQSTLQLVLRAGREVLAVPGEKTNLKLTDPDDLILAQGLNWRLA